MPRRTLPRASALIGFLLTLLFAPDCAMERASKGEDGGDPEDIAKSEGVVLSAATWTLAWDTAGIDLDPNGGWSVTTNLDYRVRVDLGYHVSHGVSLAACQPGQTSASSFFGLPVPSAYAHTDEEDPSAIELLTISDLARPGDVELGASTFTPTRYCKVFWLLARGMPGAATDDGLDMSNRSLVFSGTWERGATSGVLDIDTWWPQGKLDDLAAVTDPAVFEAAAEDGDVRFAFVTIESPLGRAFDDVDFAAEAPAVVADRVIDNLTAGARFVVDLRSP